MTRVYKIPQYVCTKCFGRLYTQRRDGEPTVLYLWHDKYHGNSVKTVPIFAIDCPDKDKVFRIIMETVEVDEV